MRRNVVDSRSVEKLVRGRDANMRVYSRMPREKLHFMQIAILLCVHPIFYGSAS